MRSRGLVGMDALILTIAILLAASVISAALYTTVTTLTSHDREAVKQKAQGLQKPVVIEQVRAVDTSGNKRIDYLTVLITHRGPDEPFSFNDTVVIVNTHSINCTSLAFGPTAKENCTFDVVYNVQGRDFEQNDFHSGDIVELRFSGPNLFPGIEDISSKIIIIPSNKMATTVSFRIPDRVHPSNMQIWPISD